MHFTHSYIITTPISIYIYVVCHTHTLEQIAAIATDTANISCVANIILLYVTVHIQSHSFRQRMEILNSA